MAVRWSSMLLVTTDQPDERSDGMDYSEILHALQNASLFDLYRLRTGIDGLLAQPERLLSIKRRLQPGMEISYFSPRDNALLEAVVEEVRRTCLYVRNKADGQQWSIGFCAVNLDGVSADIHPRQGQTSLSRNQLKVGESVGFHDRDSRERYGKILQLNPKTASILTTDGMRWRVAYSLLFKVMDGQGHPVSEPGLIDGDAIKG